MTGLSLVLPAYNERKTLPVVLKDWKKALISLHIPFEIIVCEDGSTDGTSEYLRKNASLLGVELSQSKTRRGYGGAVLAGIKHAKHTYVLCIDSDGQCDPADLPSFWRSRNKAQVIIGWRTHREDHVQRILFSACFKAFFALLFPNPPKDPSAPFVLFQKKEIQPLLPLLAYLREGFWWGFVAACIREHISIYQLPMHHQLRLAGDTQVYQAKNIPGIALRNILGLIQLRFAPPLPTIKG